jgi:hypothetical protein
MPTPSPVMPLMCSSLFGRCGWFPAKMKLCLKMCTMFTVLGLGLPGGVLDGVSNSYHDEHDPITKLLASSHHWCHSPGMHPALKLDNLSRLPRPFGYVRIANMHLLDSSLNADHRDKGGQRFTSGSCAAVPAHLQGTSVRIYTCLLCKPESEPQR